MTAIFGNLSRHDRHGTAILLTVACILWAAVWLWTFTAYRNEAARAERAEVRLKGEK